MLWFKFLQKVKAKLERRFKIFYYVYGCPLYLFRVNKYQITIKDINDINQILDKILSL